MIIFTAYRDKKLFWECYLQEYICFLFASRFKNLNITIYLLPNKENHFSLMISNGTIVVMLRFYKMYDNVYKYLNLKDQIIVEWTNACINLHQTKQYTYCWVIFTVWVSISPVKFRQLDTFITWVNCKKFQLNLKKLHCYIKTYFSHTKFKVT